MSSQESDFADDIIADQLPAHSEPPRDEFMPWHRVRKEYIRNRQWNELAGRLVKGCWRKQLQQAESEWSLDEAADGSQLEIPEGVALDKSLNCLVIPGDDLLDVRALWRDLSPYKCFIKYLGFNEGHGSDDRGTRVHVANNAVISLGRFHKFSRVLHDRFESVAQQESMAYRYLKEGGPYHIVNLDLCGSMFPNTASSSKEYYEALHQLLAYQFSHQRHEWLLFITTMVEPSVVDRGELQKLCGPTRKNFDAHQEFVDEIAKLLPQEAFQGADSTVDLASLTEDQLTQLFGLALGKWILALCQSARPQWIVAMRRSFRYVVNEQKGAVMLSLAFELKPNITPPQDATGISTVTAPQKNVPDEKQCAIKLAAFVGHIQDVDGLLAADRNLWTQMRDAQANLLASAGYDRDAYVKWTDEGEGMPKGN
jgi:hypothetical protein